MWGVNFGNSQFRAIWVGDTQVAVGAFSGNRCQAVAVAVSACPCAEAVAIYLELLCAPFAAGQGNFMTLGGVGAGKCPAAASGGMVFQQQSPSMMVIRDNC